MSPHATIDQEAIPASYPRAREQEGERAYDAGPIDHWIDHHAQTIALVSIAVGFALRILVARHDFLNPDEALQYAEFNQRSALLAYEAGRALPHPPLFYILFYYWHLLGRSEFVLRLPSVFLGAALGWIAFKWIGCLFGKPAALIGLILTTFCPALIALSGEVRQYALFLFCMLTALYFLGEALHENSVARMGAFSVFSYLAILSHYSAFFFVVAAGLYCLTRIADRQMPRKLVIAWLGGQIGAAAIYLFLYVSHLSKLRGNIAGWGGDLDKFYFRSYRDDIFVFTGQRVLDIFRYWYAQSYVSGLMLLIFIAAAAVLFARDLVSRSKTASRLGILLLFPFVGLWLAAIAGAYPLVNTRHTVFLAPFVIAASSFLLAKLCRQKLLLSLAIAVLLVAVANLSARGTETGLTKENQRRELMVSAVDYVERVVPKGDLILSDYQSSLMLAYYLCGPEQITSADRTAGQLFKFECKGYSVVSLSFWMLRPESLPVPFEKVARAYGLKPNDRVWVFQAGWGGNLLAEGLPRQFPQFHCVAPVTFGDDIGIVPLKVGRDLAPVPQAQCTN